MRNAWYGRAALAALFVIGLYPLSPYFVPLFMGAVLCTVGWRVQLTVERALSLPRWGGAALHALTWLAVIVLPSWLVIQTLAAKLAPRIARWKSGAPLVTVPPQLAHTRFIGPWLAQHLHKLNANVLVHYLGNHSDLIKASLGHIWIFLLHTLIASAVVFSLALRGEKMRAELIWIAETLWGPRGQQVLTAAADAARSVMLGIIGVGLVEGGLIGLSYGLAGMPLWSIWLIATALLSAIPFGAGAVLALVCGWLMLTGHVFAGLLTAAWGAAVITAADLLLRPLVTGKASSVPFMALLLSILGGAKVFGLVGVIAGPLLIMLAASLWQSWLRQSQLPPPA
ncbi:AI-2E family transporter [Acidiferrobacter sp. SPIII_3]|uniref:AI-2E family transporter n=1 Tax=Acidiferrobacter sp. SPIII_3 TaxID=1281578 RepID=UPI000D7261DB|nr:AI-2E family transporter [Acidiferrobacter sp. SPIII_3]AWP23131.1 AI-2E family transporter [Acidiferrobacter sp. SPIII_3]